MTATPPHRVLAEHVRGRRRALSYGVADVAERGGPSSVSLRKVEHPTHVPTRLNASTFQQLDHVLQWPEGTAEGLHTGRLTTAPVSLIPSFREWLRQHAGRPDKYGDVADEVLSDPDWRGGITTPVEMSEYLDELNVADSFRDVLLALFDQYLTEHHTHDALEG